VRIALQFMPDVTLIGECDERGSIKAVEGQHPEIAVTESRGDAGSTLALVRGIHDVCPDCRLILLAESFERHDVRLLAHAGVVAFLLWKDVRYATIRQAVSAAIQDDLLTFSRPAAAALLGLAPADGRATWPAVAARLTTREQIVLEAFAQGLTQHQIAVRIGQSPRTVKRIVAGLVTKFDAPSPFLLGMRAREAGLPVPPT
jgi:DNA-binding NarL/FixJ family response regulator